MTGKIVIRYDTTCERDAKLRAVCDKLLPQPERISIGELARRVNRPLSTVSMALRRPSCPAFVGKQGVKRILWIEPNCGLLDWLKRNRRGERSDLERNK